jgi:hypothetical protein
MDAWVLGKRGNLSGADPSTPPPGSAQNDWLFLSAGMVDRHAIRFPFLQLAKKRRAASAADKS